MTAKPSLTLHWNDCGRAEWHGYLTAADRSSLEQSWAYGAAMAAYHGQTVDRVIIRQGHIPVAMAQLYRKNLMGVLSVVRIVRGPLFLDGQEDGEPRQDILRAFRDAFSLRRGDIPFWLPELSDTPRNQTLMRSLGTRRMVTGMSSAWLDLSRDEAELRKGMTGSWRNALRMAEKNKANLVITDSGDDISRDLADYDSFHRQKRFMGPSGGFVAAIAAAGQETGDVLVLTANAGADRVAGIVLIRHGASATYFISWTTETGRGINAHNLLLWRGIQALKDSGIRWLDLGGLNTGSGAGIARFKLGLGPDPFTMAGTFL
ncbi:MAG: GNAT family N-acetyltransferase [Rhodospirillaceae bacterium]|jgi:hypothetical protein|nr:GNAT family N-acetyltransferase [Rhodospirillaceae bacterium]MBT5455943.1 GNAT family N-acetyltransferase [Rhodospirillaceae bacterium]